MVRNSPKVTFLLGLAGSGKTFRADELRQETGARFFEGIEGDIKTKEDLLKHLGSGGSSIVEEIAYCHDSCRKTIVSELRAVSPDVEIEWICFENDLESANWNVIHRKNKGDPLGHRWINEQWHELYSYPSNAHIIPIYKIKRD